MRSRVMDEHTMSCKCGTSLSKDRNSSTSDLELRVSQQSSKLSRQRRQGLARYERCFTMALDNLGDSSMPKNAAMAESMSEADLDDSSEIK
jgi:hypothetical protein